MESIIKKLKSVYICAAGVLLSAAFVYMLSVIWAFKVNPLAVIAVSAAVSAYVHLILKNKNGWMFLMLPVVVAAVIFAYAQLNALTLFDGIVKQTWSYWQGETEYSALNAYILTLTAAIPISSAVYFLHKKYILRTVMAILAAVGGITAMVIKQDVPKFTAFSAIIYVFLFVIETTLLINSRKRDSASSFNASVFLFPAVLLSVFLAVWLPSSSNPIDWRFLLKIYNAAHERAEIIMTEISYIFNKGESEFSITGFSNSDISSLGGNISDNDSVILYVNTARRTNGNMYLTGSVKNVYDGNKWSNRGYHSDYYEYSLDYLELYYALYRNEITPTKFIYKRNAELTYNNIKTNTLFYPIKTFAIDENNLKKIDFSQAGIKYKKAKGENNKYTLSFLDIDYTNDTFDSFMKNTDNVDYYDGYSAEDFNRFIEKYMSYKPNNYVSNLNSNLPAVLETRQENIYASYLNIPDTVPQRVYELADELTKDCKTDYEKLKAIEEYLNANYYYTKSPGEVPKGREITDYFLFDSKQGYCTYFATAMAVLGRAEGIPTRYVEGVLVDFGKTTKINTYPVIGNNTHAWTEAYIKGVGWIPFEPTSSYYSKRYAEAQKSVIYSPTDFGLQSYKPNTKNPDEEISSSDSKEEKTEKQIGVFIVILSVFSVVIFSVLYYNIIKYKYARRYDKAEPKYKYRLYFSEILYYLDVMGYSIGKSETVIQFADRIACSFDDNIRDVADTYTKLRFSSAVPKKHEYTEAAELLHNAEEKALKEKGTY